MWIDEKVTADRKLYISLCTIFKLKHLITICITIFLEYHMIGLNLEYNGEKIKETLIHFDEIVDESTIVVSPL